MRVAGQGGERTLPYLRETRLGAAIAGPAQGPCRGPAAGSGRWSGIRCLRQGSGRGRRWQQQWRRWWCSRPRSLRFGQSHRRCVSRQGQGQGQEQGGGRCRQRHQRHQCQQRLPRPWCSRLWSRWQPCCCASCWLSPSPCLQLQRPRDEQQWRRQGQQCSPSGRRVQRSSQRQWGRARVGRSSEGHAASWEDQPSLLHAASCLCTAAAATATCGCARPTCDCTRHHARPLSPQRDGRRRDRWRGRRRDRWRCGR